jgi:hypothetical protein
VLLRNSEFVGASVVVASYGISDAGSGGGEDLCSALKGVDAGTGATGR